MPTELELIALNTEFDLYLPFTKRLVLNLPDATERTRAAQWLQKLRSIQEDNSKKLRNEHLKLLLFALHRRAMVGVFGVPPSDELESFHDGLTLLEMTRELIEITEKQKQNTGDDTKESPLPKVLTSLSYDLKEYAAAQMIPKFGSHCYFALSKEPIQFWRKSGFGNYPSNNEMPNQHMWEMAIAKISDGVLEQQAALDKAIENAKKIESGELDPDDVEPAIDFNKKIAVKPCLGGSGGVFKWKKDSYLNMFLELDPVGNGDFNDLEGQGKVQLEVDEEAFEVLDNSLPGRRRVVIRDPYFNDVPPDLSERRLHGVVDEVIQEDLEDEEDEYGFDESGSAVCLCEHEPTCSSGGPCSMEGHGEDRFEDVSVCGDQEEMCTCDFGQPDEEAQNTICYDSSPPPPDYNAQYCQQAQPQPQRNGSNGCACNDQFNTNYQQQNNFQQYEDAAWAAAQTGAYEPACDDNYFDMAGYDQNQTQSGNCNCENLARRPC